MLTTQSISIHCTAVLFLVLFAFAAVVIGLPLLYIDSGTYTSRALAHYKHAAIFKVFTVAC